MFGAWCRCQTMRGVIEVTGVRALQVYMSQSLLGQDSSAPDLGSQGGGPIWECQDIRYVVFI